MNILTIVANPKDPSFTRRMNEIFVEAANAKGHTVRSRDLYAMGFNPVASAEDLTGNLRGDVAEDVRIEQEHVRWADLIVMVHPIWWIDRPAIMKGYIDRVFALGFAYGYRSDSEEGGLKGKKAVLLTCSGSTEENFTETGKDKAIETAILKYTLEFCDLEVLGHLHFGPVGRRSSPEMIEGYLDTVRAFVSDKL